MLLLEPTRFLPLVPALEPALLPLELEQELLPASVPLPLALLAFSAQLLSLPLAWLPVLLPWLLA